MASSREFKHETIQDQTSILEYLTVITDGFKNKELVFRSEKEQIILKPDGMVQLEVKAKKKDRKVKLELRFDWKENPSDSVDDSLVINSKIK